MRLILTEEERALRKIFEPYYDGLKTPSLSPDAPEEAVKAYKNIMNYMIKREQKRKHGF
jgi:hypothetical protein